jgi:hypothetical protein
MVAMSLTSDEAHLKDPGSDRLRKDGVMDDPPRLRVVGGEANAEDEQLHPEVAEVVRWFTSWWLTRGLKLVAEEEPEERRAA